MSRSRPPPPQRGHGWMQMYNAYQSRYVRASCDHHTTDPPHSWFRPSVPEGSAVPSPSLTKCVSRTDRSNQDATRAAVPFSGGRSRVRLTAVLPDRARHTTQRLQRTLHSRRTLHHRTGAAQKSQWFLPHRRRRRRHSRRRTGPKRGRRLAEVAAGSSSWPIRRGETEGLGAG